MTTETKIDMKEMMEKYKELATPGKQHKMLLNMAGTWNVKCKSWMDPEKPPEESTGISERKMLLDGRYLHEVYSGKMCDAPFNGIGITGYDNNTKRYNMIWMDNMGTGIYFFEGNESADGKTITMESCYNDPFKGEMKWRSVCKIKDNNTQEFEMFSIDSEGKESKCVENIYTRKK